MEVEFERDALFIEVWQTPMSTLAKKYGISDSGLRKVCLALAIPLPRQGHWAKIAAGHQIPIPSLPPSDRSKFISRVLEPADVGVIRPKDDPQLKEALAYEGDPVNRILASDVLFRPHRLVAAAVEAIRKEIAGLERSRTKVKRPVPWTKNWEPDWSTFQRPSWSSYKRRGYMELSPDVLPMLVSIEASDRALRIWDSVLKACEARGMTVSVEPRRLCVCAGQESAHLRMSERFIRADEPAGSGELRIFAIYCGETKFADKSEQVLEVQLNDVMRWLHKTFAILRSQRITAIERKRAADIASEAALQQKIADEARQREEQKAEAQAAAMRLADQGFCLEANAWDQAQKIRAYIAHLQTNSAASGKPASRQFLAWVAAASEAADRMDPTPGRLDPST